MVAKKVKAPALVPSLVPESAVTVIPVSELKPNLTVDFNCRSPSRHSKAYLSMREVLRDAPEMFVKLNGGMTLANRHILDGGHTYLAIQDAIAEGDLEDPSKAFVRVTDMGDLSNDEMAMRSVALNRRVTPPLIGEKDLLGHWEMLKIFTQPLGNFEFRPNTVPEANYTVSFLVALLNGWTSKTAEKSYSSKGSLVRLYSDDKYMNILPLLPQMIEVYSFIYEALGNEEKLVAKLIGYRADREVVLPNGKTITGFIPESYLWPAYGALQMLVDEQGELTKDPIELIKSRMPAIVKTLLADYKKSGSGPAKYGKDSINYLNMTVCVLGTK